MGKTEIEQSKRDGEDFREGIVIWGKRRRLVAHQTGRSQWESDFWADLKDKGITTRISGKGYSMKEIHSAKVPRWSFPGMFENTRQTPVSAEMWVNGEEQERSSENNVLPKNTSPNTDFTKTVENKIIQYIFKTSFQFLFQCLEFFHWIFDYFLGVTS